MSRLKFAPWAGVLRGSAHGVPDDLRARVAEEAPDDFLTMYQTMRLLGVSRQTVWQRVKRGEIKALHVRRGRKKGLRLKVIRSQSDLFDQTATHLRDISSFVTILRERHPFEGRSFPPLSNVLMIGRWQPDRRCDPAPQWMRLQIYGLGADQGGLIVGGHSSRADRNRALASCIHSHICSVAYPVLDSVGEMLTAESDPITLTAPSVKPSAQ